MSNKLPDDPLLTDVLTENSGVSYLLSIRDGQPTPLRFGPSFSALLGFPAQQWLRHPTAWREAIHADDRDRYDAAIASIIEHGYWSLEYRLRSAAGDYRAFRDVATLSNGQQGPQINGLLLDIDEDYVHRQQQSDLLAALQRADAIIFNSPDLDTALPELLDLALQIFTADRAWLLHPCDPDASHWQVPLERTRTAWPGAFAIGHPLPMTTEIANTLRTVLNSSQPLLFGPREDHPLPADSSAQFSIQSQMVMAVRPHIGDPWLFGVHYCATAHHCDSAEVKRFQFFGDRLGEALGACLLLQQLERDQQRYRHVFEQAPVSLWEEDASAVKDYLDTIRASGIDNLSAWFDQNPDAISHCADLIKILDVNQATLELYAAKNKQDLLGNLNKTFNASSLLAFQQELLAFSNDQFRFSGKAETNTLQGKPLAIRVRAAIAPEHQHDWSRVLVAITDITPQQQAEAEILALNRTHSLISECSQALMRADNVEALLDAICREIIEDAGYRFAWLGLIESPLSVKQVRRVAQAGTSHCYLNRERIGWGDDADGQNATGSAIRNKMPIVNQDQRNNPHCSTCLNLNHDQGHVSSIVLPIIERGQVYGTLNICSAQSNAFSDSELKLLQEFSGDVAYGIRVLRDREEQTRTRNHLQALHNASPDMLFILSRDGQVIDANDNALRAFGFPNLEALIMSNSYRLFGSGTEFAPYHEKLKSVRNGETADFEWKTKRKDGREFDVEVRLRRLDDHGRVLALLRDISIRKSLQARLSQQAYYDELTGLANRRLALERMSLALSIAKRDQHAAALMLLDLDNFKQVNDTYGHSTGDRLLIRVAEHLNTAIRSSDTVARLGGDEFLILMTDIHDQDDILSLANKILHLLDRATIVDGHNLAVTTSIGIARYPSDGKDSDALLKAADSAMYKAKQEGRNTYRFFSADLDQRMKRYMALGTALQQAISQQQLEVYYQPVVDSQGHAIGAEALLRWQHPRWGWVSPTEFIPVAEDRGLIIELGTRVLQQACEQLQQWRAQGLAVDWVSVNLSPRQFWKQDLVGTVSDILKTCGLEGTRLKLEITEGLLLEHPSQAVATLKGLQALDVHLALDDFGTGYSSLSYLKKYPFDSLKIDRSFIENLHQDTDDLSLTRTIIAMARGLGLQVIAEGVENEVGARLLVAEGCDLLQGFLYSPALPADEFATWAQASTQHGKRSG